MYWACNYFMAFTCNLYDQLDVKLADKAGALCNRVRFDCHNEVISLLMFDHAHKVDARYGIFSELHPGAAQVINITNVTGVESGNATQTMVPVVACQWSWYFLTVSHSLEAPQKSQRRGRSV
jgi:hypothetical protein